MKRMLAHQNARPFVILCATIGVFGVVDWGEGRVLNLATAFSVMQLFATFGLVALGLGLSMMIREFDLSVAGLYGLGGCVAVLAGGVNPWIGIACAVAVGLIGGLIQGLIIVWLHLGSIGVTLGGLLSFGGLAYVITENRAVTFSNMELALGINAKFAGILSVRSAVALGIFVIAALIMAYTRIGRDIRATGGDRRASMIAGVNTGRIVVGVFAASGTLAAFAGALLAYSLASASPSGLTEVLVPATTAAILGGVSLAGGTGHPLGIVAGVLTFCLLRSGLNATGVSPYGHDIATGAILLVVAILDGPDLLRRITALGLRRGRAPAS